MAEFGSWGSRSNVRFGGRGRRLARIASVIVWVIGAQALEAPVHPQVLFRRFENLLLEQRVQSLGILEGVRAGKILDRRTDDDPVTARREPLRKVGHHPRSR